MMEFFLVLPQQMRPHLFVVSTAQYINVVSDLFHAPCNVSLHVVARQLLCVVSHIVTVVTVLSHFSFNITSFSACCLMLFLRMLSHRFIIVLSDLYLNMFHPGLDYPHMCYVYVYSSLLVHC